MVISDVKKNLGELVLYSDENMKDVHYKLTACTLRKNKKNEFEYSAELQDIQNNNSILICDLSRIKAIYKKSEKIFTNLIKTRY